MSTIFVTSTTQKIIMNSATGSIAVINAGPQGPPGAPGSSDGGSGGGGGAGFVYQGEIDYVDVNTDIIGGMVTVALDPLVKQRLANLEASRALVQIKDSLASGGPANYMNFPGTTGNYISTPNNSAYNVAGDFCVVARIQKPVGTQAADFTIAARYNSLPGAAQWRLLLVTAGANAGCLRFVSTVDGTVQSIPTTTAPTPLDGSYIWVKVRRRASDGDTGFWTAPDTGSNNVLPATWTALGLLNRGSTAGVLYNNGGALSLPVTIGAYNAGASFPYTGRIGRVIGYAGLDETGTVVFDANAATYVSGTTWTGAAGRVWTINGTASVVLVGGATSNTSSEFSLGETDAFTGIAVLNHDTLLWSTEATLKNESAAAVNFTPKLKIAGVDLFTFPAISIPNTAAGQIYNLGCAVKVSVNASDGTTQIARAQLIINNAVAGTDAGSIVMASNLSNLSGNRTGAIATITSIPQIQLRMTMATAAANISSRPLRSELFIARA